MENFDAVIFDLDGTLTESEPGIVRSVQYALDKMGYRDYDMETLRSFIGPPLLYSFTTRFQMDEAHGHEAIGYYRERYWDIGWRENAVYPGIAPLLRDLKRHGVWLGLATAKPAPMTDKVLDHFGLRPYFDRVAAIDMNDHRADKETLVKRALPEKFRRACMVGDRVNDLDGGHRAGIEAVGVRYGYAEPGELEAGKADCIAPDVQALTDYLLGDRPRGKGWFITLEGPDGCGKSTQLPYLAEWLRKCGYLVKTSREPGGCRIAERIRDLVLDAKETGMDDVCEALLFAAARAQHVREVIEPARARGELVLCDRYVDSSVAYQGAGRGLGMAAISAINAPAVDGCMPDATILLDIDPALALKRRMAENAPDRIESAREELQRRVYEGYLEIARAHPERVARVDASGTEEEVALRVRAAVMARLARP